MPHNLVWLFKFPHYYVTVESLLYAPPIPDLATGARLVRDRVLQALQATTAPRPPLAVFSERADMTMPRG